PRVRGPAGGVCLPAPYRPWRAHAIPPDAHEEEQPSDRFAGSVPGPLEPGRLGPGACEPLRGSSKPAPDARSNGSLAVLHPPLRRTSSGPGKPEPARDARLPFPPPSPAPCGKLAPHRPSAGSEGKRSQDRFANRRHRGLLVPPAAGGPWPLRFCPVPDKVCPAPVPPPDGSFVAREPFRRGDGIRRTAREQAGIAPEKWERTARSVLPEPVPREGVRLPPAGPSPDKR